MTTLSLEASKKVFEIVGEYETKKRHPIMSCGCKDPESCMYSNQVEDYIPLPNFAELVRVAANRGAKPEDMPLLTKHAILFADVALIEWEERWKGEGV